MDTAIILQPSVPQLDSRSFEKVGTSTVPQSSSLTCPDHRPQETRNNGRDRCSWAFRWSSAKVAPSPRTVRKTDNLNAARHEHLQAQLQRRRYGPTTSR